MVSFKSIEEIELWAKARNLTIEIYRISERSKMMNDYSFTNQIRSAVVSIMSNVAEGFERGGSKEFIQFLSIAKGSAGELSSLLYVALDQGYIEERVFDVLLEKTRQISRMLGGLMRYLRKSELRGPKYKGISD